MSEDIYIDVNYLTESERDVILQVLAKDEELRKQEKRRISSLKNELDQIKKNGASQEEIETSRICARCRTPLGFIFNSGALCPKCEARVCKICREETSDSWLCILCAKIREVRAESGAWFFEQERRKGDRPQLYGSALVRASFRRAKPTAQPRNDIKDADPGSPPVITLNLSNHDRIHRPVPVHMSRLPEKDVEEEEEEERKNAVEINQNYKQYVKANQVPRKPGEEQSDADEQEKGSASSASSTPRDVDNIGDVTVTNPEIVCTDDITEQEEGQRTPTHDDDIDQAFAMYERDHPGTKTLQEQLNILSMGSRESIVSYYSDAGEGRFGNVTVTGEVLFGLKYNKHKHQLEVQIHRAKDIAAADEKRGRSDPYVKVYLLPDKTKGGKRKTRSKKNTLNPDFDEILTFKIGFEEMLTRTLWLAMWNHDTFGHNDFLGEVMLPLDTYQDSGFSWDDPSPNWYPLRERRPEPSLMAYCGDLTVSLMYEPGEESHKDKKKKKKSGGKLHIQLKEARNLPAKDSNGFSDPFCKRNFPKLFDQTPGEKKSEAQSEVDGSPDKSQTPEAVPLVSSHENLAFEEEDKHLEPKDTSTDSTTSTMETTLESVDSEEGLDVKEVEKANDDSGISVSHVNGSDVSPVEEGTTTDGDEDSGPSMQPVLKSISAFAMQFTVAGPPAIKVDKPLTLSSVAKGDSKEATPTASPQSPKKHAEHNINKATKTGALQPEAALIKRRHSDFAVSAPRPVNEELAIADLKKRGSQQARLGTVRKGSHPDVIRTGKGPQWSPSLERKRIEEAKKGAKKETRRKTLAELALEAGYTSPDSTGPPVRHPGALQVTKAEASKGSNESLLSDPGEEHYSSVPVTGEVFVSLRYEMPSKKFEVHVHSANNLACADAKKSSSDPYVKSYLLPDRRSKRKTKTKKDTLNPNFDEVLEYFMGYDELLTRTLFLSVWHKSIGRNYFLGEVKIPMNNFVEAGNSLEQPVAKWFNLTNKTDETDGLPEIPCELVLALKYVTADKVKKKGRHKGELHVHLLEARNLPGMDADGMSDPYCKCLLLPDKKGKFKHKTPIIKRTLNPTFDHKFSYDELSPDDLKERVLEITIYDFDRASTDEFLGGVRLGLGTSSNEWDDATEDECQIWHTMLSRSNVWIQVVVPLRSDMTLKKKQ
ncbi:uncharacterized protein LOC144656073 isoform X3 [Oculina patagonica]